MSDASRVAGVWRKMSKNVKAKSNSRRNKPIVSHSGSAVLLTKFGTASLFQVGGRGGQEAAHKGGSDKTVKAVIEQLGFDCIQLQGEISVPSNSKLWPKLPD